MKCKNCGHRLTCDNTIKRKKDKMVHYNGGLTGTVCVCQEHDGLGCWCTRPVAIEEFRS